MNIFAQLQLEEKIENLLSFEHPINGYSIAEGLGCTSAAAWNILKDLEKHGRARFVALQGFYKV